MSDTARDLSAEIEIEPAFHDFDPMEVVWHGHYVKYLELARCALFAKFDYDYPQMRESGFVWPVVDLQLQYLRSVRMGSRLKVQARIVEWESRLRIQYQLRDAADGTRVMRASSVQVPVELATGAMRVPCPPVLWERLGVASGAS